MPLQIGKTPIVVPRQHQFNEHVNDHQVEFARNVAQRMGTIIPVEDINTLGDVITNYDQIVAGMEWQFRGAVPEKGTAQRPGRFGNRSAAGSELGEAGVYHAVYERSVQNTELLCRD